MSANFDLAPSDWATLRRLLGEALERPVPERTTWLESLDPQFEAFKPRLRALLDHAAQGTEALVDTLPRVETLQFAERVPAGTDDEFGADDRVGLYRLMRRLGEGGMGEVWLAERIDMLQGRAVALKLPRVVTGRAALAQRLAREREILATLAHPNIARLYDAGLSADGQPYIALEYVEGERIDAYCMRKALPVPARLQLFLQVARAVAHAHARLVVHRDLKPANILVTEAGEVKLLDFGIAKLLADGPAQETQLTQLAGRALTPDYAAPEQILGQPIGTAADVYALGVVLFELLTGQRPYRLKRDSRAALEEAILQAEVRRPSEVAAEPRRKKQLRGDLDTIVLKALKRTPEERYSSVEALADDVERFLARRPVAAQPDRVAYRLARFLSRNRYAVAATAAVLTTALAGTAVSLWQARIAAQERDVALREKKNADEVKNFALAMFRDAGPQNAAGRVLSTAEVLRRARDRIATIDPARAEVRLELLTTVADSLLMLEDAKEAEAVLLQAVQEGTERLGKEHGLVLRSKSILSQSYRRQSRYAEMEAVLDEILPTLRMREDKLPNLLLSALVNKSNLDGDRGRFTPADQSAQEGLAVIDRRFAGRHSNAVLLHTRRSGYAVLQGDGGAALAHAEQAMKLALEIHQGNARHATVLFARAAQADALLSTGRIDDAVTQVESLLADTEAAFAGRTRVHAMRVLAAAPIYIEAGLPHGFVDRSAEALATLTGYQGSDRDDVTRARGMATHATVLLSAGRAAEAAALLAQASPILRGMLGADNALSIYSTQLLARALALSGQADRSAEVLQQVPGPEQIEYPALALQAWTARLAALQRIGNRSESSEANRAIAALAPRVSFLPRETRAVLPTAHAAAGRP